MKTKNIVLLGATASIGSSTLKLIQEHRDCFNLIGISANQTSVTEINF